MRHVQRALVQPEARGRSFEGRILKVDIGANLELAWEYHTGDAPPPGLKNVLVAFEDQPSLIEGNLVEHIGWRLSRIRRFDKRPLYLPNSIFTQIAVENPSRMSHRRIFETIGIRYADMDRIEPITQAVKAMLSQHEAVIAGEDQDRHPVADAALQHALAHAHAGSCSQQHDQPPEERGDEGLDLRHVGEGRARAAGGGRLWSGGHGRCLIWRTAVLSNGRRASVASARPISRFRRPREVSD